MYWSLKLLYSILVNLNECVCSVGLPGCPPHFAASGLDMLGRLAQTGNY